VGTFDAAAAADDATGMAHGAAIMRELGKEQAIAQVRDNVVVGAPTEASLHTAVINLQTAASHHPIAATAASANAALGCIAQHVPHLHSSSAG
jgi:hypothetical protein